MTQKNNTPEVAISNLSLDLILSRVWGLGLILLVALAFWYLLMLNSLATKGFLLEEMKEDRLVLQKEIEDLDIQLAIPTSLYALESSELVQGMPDETRRLFFYIDPKDKFAMNVNFE